MRSVCRLLDRTGLADWLAGLGRPVQTRRRDRFLGRKGSVSMWVAVAAPTVMMMGGLALEAGQFANEKLHLQSVADIAAVAGVMGFANTQNQQTGANTAANLAEVNGITGTTSRVWDSGTTTLTDNLAKVTVGPGRLSADTLSFTVTVAKDLTNSFSRLFGGSATVRVSATSSADAVPAATGGQPCVLALQTSGTPLNVSGSTNINAINCTLRSNAAANFWGSGSISANAVYAGGSITVGSSTTLNAPQNPNAGSIADPYAGFQPIKDALAKLSPGAGTAIKITGGGSQTLNPGTYSSISVASGANLTLNPGLYVVNGDISFGGSSTVTGNGVTIVSSGTITYGGSSYVTLTAADANATSGAIPGIIFAGTSTGASSMQGTGNQPVTGVIYYPNGPMTYAGNATTNGCAEVIALTVSLTGSSSLESSCAFYGALSFTSAKLTYTAQLTQ